MSGTKEVIVILNDLIRINNDRTLSYKKAGEELKEEDIDLRGLFNQYAIESKLYANKLELLVASIGEEPAEDTLLTGELYQTWMNLKPVIKGTDRASILDACAFAEEAILKAYESALESETQFSDVIYDILEDHQFALKEVHRNIKLKKDMLQVI